MVLVDNDTFLAELTKLFQSRLTRGAVTMIIKWYGGRTKPIPKGKPPPPPSEHACLVRAKAKRRKLSTIVHAEDVEKFHLAYYNVLETNCDGLKKFEKIEAMSSEATQ